MYINFDFQDKTKSRVTSEVQCQETTFFDHTPTQNECQNYLLKRSRSQEWVEYLKDLEGTLIAESQSGSNILS